MREHTHRLEVRLNDREYRKLKTLVAKTKLPQSAVIRKLIEQKEIIEYPPADYFNAYMCLEKCRLDLHLADLFNKGCRNCTACRETLAACQRIWDAFFAGLFDPTCIRATNENSKEE